MRRLRIYVMALGASALAGLGLVEFEEWVPPAPTLQEIEDAHRRAVNENAWFPDGRWAVESRFDHGAHWKRQAALMKEMP